MTLSVRSEKNLIGVHPDLVRVVRKAAEMCHDGFGFIVTEGLRTKERQEMLVKKGASKTMNSKHLVGRAVDLAVTLDGEVHWDWPLYTELSLKVKCAAGLLGVPITWGGDWKTFKDGPHFELRDEWI